MKTLLYTALIFLSACGGSSSNYDQSYAPMEAEVAMTETAAARSESRGAENSRVLDEAVSEQIERKLIKTGNIHFQVEDFEVSRAFIESAIEKYDAYVARSNQSNDRYRINQSMQIRVKADQLDALTGDLLTQSIFTHYNNVNVRDVTEEFLDLEIRLKNKKAVEEQYRAILKKATTIKDILEVEKQIAQIREDIEAQEGRLKFLSNQVDYHTLQVDFYQELEFTGSAPERSFLSKLWAAVVGGWNLLEELVLMIIGLWPLWLVAFPVGFWIWRKFKRKIK